MSTNHSGLNPASKKGLAELSVFAVLCAVLIFFGAVGTAFGADGSGTNTVDPTSANVGSTGNTFTFTFTAAETMDSGEIKLQTPSGWSSIQGVFGTAGYTTASSVFGIIADVLNALNAATNWTATQHMSLSTSSDVNAESSPASSLSFSNAITATAAANEQWYFNYGSASNWGVTASPANLTVGMFLKSSVNTSAGDLSWQDDNSADLASPLDTIALPALSANTWTYASATLGATSRTSISSYGFRYTTDIGAATVQADSLSVIFQQNDSNNGWSGDGSITDSTLTGAGNFKEGTGSVRCTYGSRAGIGASGDCWNNEGSAITVGPGTTIGLWIRPSVALNAGDFAWIDDNSTNLGSPSDVISLPALAANTWTYVTVDAPNSGSIRSFGVRQIVDKGAMTIDLDAIGKMIDTADATTGWTAPTATVQTLSADSSVFHEGTASLKNVVTAAAGVGDTWYETLGSAQNWSSYTTVGFWIRSTVATLAGDLQFQYSANSDLTSPIATLDIGALAANTWTYQKLTLSGTRTSVNSFGIKHATDIGAATIYLDDVLLGPGSAAYSGGAISTRILSLANGQTVVFSYGNGGGTSGVTAPATAGTATATTTSRVSDSGALTEIASHPTLSAVETATKFVIIQPSNGTVGTPTTVTVQAQKSDNSVDTNYQSDVTLNASGSATGGGLVNIVNGVGTKDISDTVAEAVTLSLTDSEGTGLNVSSTQSLTFAAGAVASFSLTDPGDMYARTRLGYTVTRKDQYGNAVGAATTTVYLYTTSTGGTQKFYDDSLAGSIITSIDIGPGHSTANFWYYDETPGTYTITASDNASAPDGATGVADATDSVIVLPVATKFVIIDPSDGTVDAPITVTVQAQKPDNSVDTNYQSDVTLNASGSATGDGLVSIVNGVGTMDISDTVAETVNLSLTDSESTGLDVSSTQSVVFAAGAIAQFTLNHPGTVAAGERAAYTITRKDQYGNEITAATSAVYLYSSSTGLNKKFYNAATAGSVITSITVGDGQSTAQVWYYDETPGTWTITASDNASAPDGNTGVNDAIDSLEVTAGPTATLLLNDPGDMTVGTRLGYTVTRKDAFANLVTIGATAVYMYSNSSGASSPAFYDAATDGNTVTSLIIGGGQSSANVWYADSNEGTWTITASDNASAPDGTTGIADATDSVVVSAAPIVATRFVIAPPTDGTVDAPITITVRAEDGSGNLDTTYQSDVTLNASGSATGDGLVNIVNGVGTKDISDTVAEDVDLSLTDSQGTGLDVSSTQSVTFAAGAVAQFTLDNPGDTAAGTRVGYVVTRKDQYGNAVTSGATTAYLYSTSDGVNKRFYDAASGGSAITSIVITDGVSAASFWQYDEKAGSWFITASDNASAADGATGIADASDAIVVQPAATAQFLLDDPGNMTASTRLGYTVTRKDAFANLVTSGVSLAYLYSSSTGTTTAFYSSASGGAATGFATINDGSSSGTFWYYDETPGTWAVTASDNASAPDGATGVQDAVDSVTVSAIPIVATRFVISPVATVQIGTAASVTVEAQDDNGNIDTTYQTGVTLAASGSATGGGVVSIVNGIGTRSISNTVAETVVLSLTDSQGTGLNVSSTQNLTFSATPVAPSTLGAGPGGFSPPAPVIIGARLSGLAFPGARVQVLAVSPQGSILQGQTMASSAGAFSILLKNIAVGVGSYGIVGTDDFGRTTQTKVFNANYETGNALLSLDSVLSPTLGLVHPTVRQNDLVGFVGMAMPLYTIEVQIDGTTLSTVGVAGADGSYKIIIPTGNLALGTHTVRVRQVSAGGLRSDYSPQKIFTVTSLFTPQTDFNQDGVINVQDWSIFLSRWSSADAATRLLNDLNGDGKLDVSDLSVFVRTLKR